MNIFYLDQSPKLAAEYHCDKHVVKMILETAQLLSTAHRILDGSLYIDKTKNGRSIKRWEMESSKMESVLYKATHANHPSAVWCRESLQNYQWLYELFKELSSEYEYRYGRVHLSWEKLGDILKNPPKNIKDMGATPIKQAMPDEFKDPDGVQAYRNYYIGAKSGFSVWTKREVPEFMEEHVIA